MYDDCEKENAEELISGILLTLVCAYGRDAVRFEMQRSTTTDKQFLKYGDPALAKQPDSWLVRNDALRICAAGLLSRVAALSDIGEEQKEGFLLGTIEELRRITTRTLVSKIFRDLPSEDRREISFIRRDIAYWKGLEGFEKQEFWEEGLSLTISCALGVKDTSALATLIDETLSSLLTSKEKEEIMSLVKKKKAKRQQARLLTREEEAKKVVSLVGRIKKSDR